MSIINMLDSPDLDPGISAEQQTAEPPAPPLPAEPAPPRGRPWVKGQSGNPAGRPSRARKAAYVAEALIQRKTVLLADKLISLALEGDRTALRLCFERLSPPRREPPVALELPVIADRAALRAALAAVADAIAAGELSTAQAATLTRTLTTLWQYG